MTDKILLPNGELIERTYFSKDLKVGDKLYGVQDKKGSHYNKDDGFNARFEIVEVTIQKIGRKYAEFTKVKSEEIKKMLLEDCTYISDWHVYNLKFFKERDEAEAYIQNQKMIEDAEQTIRKVATKRLDIELALRIQNAFPEY